MAEEMTKGRWKGARAFARQLKSCIRDPRYNFSFEDGFYGFTRELRNGYVIRINPRSYRYPEGKVSVSLWHDNKMERIFSDVAKSRVADTADALAKIAEEPITDFSKEAHWKFGKPLY